LCKEEGRLFGSMRCGDLGVGALKPKSIGLDVSYQAALYEERTITGNRNPTVNGLYKTTLHTGGVSIKIAY
jgi:long-chain fatty acid transport protein